MKRFVTCMAVVPLIVLAACGKNQPSTNLATPGPSASGAVTPKPIGTSYPAGDARIGISSPKDGDTAPTGDVRVVTTVEGIKLVDKVGKDGKQGEGHIVYYLGTGYQVPTAKGQSAVSGGSGTFTSLPSAETSYTWPNVPSGRQTLTVQLVNNDNTPLDPPQTDQVTITVP
jgi:hypothetical protein